MNEKNAKRLYRMLRDHQPIKCHHWVTYKGLHCMTIRARDPMGKLIEAGSGPLPYDDMIAEAWKLWRKVQQEITPAKS